MKNIMLLLLLISFLSNCQKQNISKEMDNPKLLDGIVIDKGSLFDKEELHLKMYRYNGEYLEDIRIKELLDTEYQHDLVKDLTKIPEGGASLITQLLLLRIYQLNDERAFKILLDLSKNETMSYNGIELYELTITRILIENPSFFIEQCYKNQDADFLKYIVTLFNQYFISKEFFELNIGYLESDGGELLLNPKMENTFGINFRDSIKRRPKIKVIFSPSQYSDWENKTLYFTDVSSVFGKQMTDKLSVGASFYYNIYVLPELDKFIMPKSERKTQNNEYPSINNEEITAFFNKENAQQYTISDPDGYTNLRTDKNPQSGILQRIKSGEKIEVLDDTGDWWKVKTTESKIGYIHKSRIKSSSNRHSTVYKLYDRPDFSSFSRAITVKRDIEILHNISGWDFIKADGTTGYLPTPDVKKEKPNRSFLADEAAFPQEKKGFWKNIFG